jgi:hypothetical protein
MLADGETTSAAATWSWHLLTTRRDAALGRGVAM